jgi:unsaturated rhamnogalacturonyl hydrolase
MALFNFSPKRQFFLICFSVLVFIFLTRCENSKSTKNTGVLDSWPENKTPEEIGNRLSNKFLSTIDSLYSFRDIYPKNPPDKAKVRFFRHMYPQTISYTYVYTWLGSLLFAEETKNDDLFKALEGRFISLRDTRKHLQPRPRHVDHTVFGAIPLELYEGTKKLEYLDLGLYYAHAQWLAPTDLRDDRRIFADQGYSWQTRLWIDDMFMITALQVQAYRATGDSKYIDRTARQMVLYLDEIQLENGLFYHHPEYPVIWGRGNGWFAVGMAELLRYLPENNPDRNRIMSGYLKMMKTLLKYQEPDGMWLQIIDDSESWKETSCTAMFTYAFITGVKNGWLDEEIYETAARKAWLELTNYINEDDELTEICQGIGRGNREHYLNAEKYVGGLFGQAAMIWCAAALLR